ncbi:MAG: ABC transporter ATP-binding protein [Candidatus Firestonebacteria bacterium RIFOXYC2_FULL_39_67]|nr:MAG: ABC transporter ATP-binding protein [Candidatus Firestonebacteria bacterium RIFOXYD2_FULL_39_29]OGF55894.1 MAG: ABC transporter ATP-binding protein [Candidatus Firestonebacteria bacterium RIFOXYC2_FULL_39_67]
MFSVEANKLTKTFGSFIAVNSISFQVRRGEIFGFIGPNGAGKSTTIRILCGILAPTKGSATVEGFDVDTASDKIKEIIGYMSQKFSLYNDLTVEENIEFFAGIHNVASGEFAARKTEILEMAGLKGREKIITSLLSGGWRQRLALGCSIIHRPKVLFLDEPTAGVDPLSRRDFWRLIRKLAEEGTTVFVTTHYMDEVENCNRLALVYTGDIIAMGSPAELKAANNTDSLEELFVNSIRKYTEKQ